MALGQNLKALESFEKCLKIYLVTIGENHSLTGITYSNFGVVYSEMGEFEKAVENLEKALTIKLTTVGKNNFSTGETYD